MAGLILAGGQSRRYGRDKAFALLGNKPLVEYVIEALAPVAGSLYIIADSAERFSGLSDLVKIVIDEVPGLGPLGGLYTGLKATPDEYCVTAPCDSPFIDSRLIQYMLKTAADNKVDALIPSYEGHLHTVNAVYSQRCLPAIESSIDDGLFRIASIFDRVKIMYVDDDTINGFTDGGLSFFNVNAPNDMVEAEQILSERGS